MSFDKQSAYADVHREIGAVLEGENDTIAIMATISCLLSQKFPYYYWTGFYMVKNDALLVGPYQGTLGCLHIPFGKGVCGTAAQERRTIVVEDVHAFPGHIACDAASQSEIVVPVFNSDKQLLAVLDVDSDQPGSFDEVDKVELEKLVAEQFARKVLE